MLSSRVLLIFSALPTVLCLISLEPGFKEFKKVWQCYIGKPLEEVKSELSLIFPNVTFSVFPESSREGKLEEFFFGTVKIVVNSSDIVIEDPYFLGSEPGIDNPEHLIGKHYTEVLGILRQNLTAVKIVVASDNETLHVSPHHASELESYILLKVDQMNTLSELPKYIRLFYERPAVSDFEDSEYYEYTEFNETEVGEPEVDVKSELPRGGDVESYTDYPYDT